MIINVHVKKKETKIERLTTKNTKRNTYRIRGTTHTVELHCNQRKKAVSSNASTADPFPQSITQEDASRLVLLKMDGKTDKTFNLSQMKDITFKVSSMTFSQLLQLKRYVLITLVH